MKSEIRLNRVFLLMILSYQCEMMNRPNSALTFFVFAVIELVIALVIAAYVGIMESE